MTIFNEKQGQFEKTIDHLKKELSNIRTGRANPSLVEDIMVDYYGTKTPLKQIASINVPDAKLLVIQPWDKNALKDIEKAIQSSPLGLNPVNDGDSLRLPIPSLTEERRRELTKVVKHKIEETKVSIRNSREEIWKILKEQKNNAKISEDQMFKEQKELQNIVDKYNSSITAIGEEKEKEIMSI
ncbi:MAG: ribosome recycling factor [Patescibacteria group bacterium]|jgi:ribosome recycling factor